MLPRTDAQVAAELAQARQRERQCSLLLRSWWHAIDVPESVRELRRLRNRHRESVWRLTNLADWRDGCAAANRRRRARERAEEAEWLKC